jgi:hypothetical protein
MEEFSSAVAEAYSIARRVSLTDFTKWLSQWLERQKIQLSQWLLRTTQTGRVSDISLRNRQNDSLTWPGVWLCYWPSKHCDWLNDVRNWERDWNVALGIVWLSQWPYWMAEKLESTLQTQTEALTLESDSDSHWPDRWLTFRTEPAKSSLPSQMPFI